MVKEKEMSSLTEIIFGGWGYFKVSNNVFLVGAQTMQEFFLNKKPKSDHPGGVPNTPKENELERSKRNEIIRGYKEREEAREAVAKGGEISIVKTQLGGMSMTETTYATTQDIKLRDVKTDILLDELIRRTEEDESKQD